MMGPRQVEQGSLFYDFSLDRHVQSDHLVRSIDRFVDLSEIRRELAAFYSEIGRPSIAPELLISYAAGWLLLRHPFRAAPAHRNHQRPHRACVGAVDVGMGDGAMKVGDICAARSGDKGDILDLTHVARDVRRTA